MESEQENPQNEKNVQFFKSFLTSIFGGFSFYHGKTIMYTTCYAKHFSAMAMIPIHHSMLINTVILYEL